MKKKAVTIYDIAQRLGLSPSTVSRGLRNDERINQHTRKLISEAAAELNYHPNRVAAGLRGGTTGTIGVIVPRIGRTFFASAISGIESVARRRGFQVIITQSNESLETEKENVAALMAARVDGIIASLSFETEALPHFENLQKQHMPLVLFDRVAENESVHRVVLDDFAASRDAARHLISVGARRLAYLGGPMSLNLYKNRHRGYLEAMREANLPVYDNYVKLNAVLEDTGYAAARALMTLPEPPDAILCASDYGALGVITYARDHGLEVPDDLMVVGFANEPFTRIITPALSSVEQFSERMGVTAAEVLFRQIDAGDKGKVVENIVLPGELQVRASSQPSLRPATNKVQPG